MGFKVKESLIIYVNGGWYQGFFCAESFKFAEDLLLNIMDKISYYSIQMIISTMASAFLGAIR